MTATDKPVTVMAYTAAPGRIALGPYLVWQRPRESLLTACHRCHRWTAYPVASVEKALLHK